MGNLKKANELLAYFLWQKRGCDYNEGDGHQLQDWLDAENEIRSQANALWQQRGSDVAPDGHQDKDWFDTETTILAPFRKTSRVIHISDLHFARSNARLGGAFPFFKTVIPAPYEQISDFLINQAAQLNANVIVHTGDITDSGNEDDYKLAQAFLRKLAQNKYTIYHVPGNHDYCKFGMIGLGGNCDLINANARQFYRKYIYSDLAPNAAYPYVIDCGGYMLILLDSMAAAIDPNGRDLYHGGLDSQGKLGQSQLNMLSGLISQHQTDRANGKKLVVCLHHHPFHYTANYLLNPDPPYRNDPNRLTKIVQDANTGLDDAAEFMQIISNKIDCLLFGHITPDYGTVPNSQNCIQQRYNNSVDSLGNKIVAEEQIFGISIINCENMEHATTDNCFITVIDFENNWTEVYNTNPQNSVNPVQIVAGTDVGNH
jgi:predicted MPP superfamily phosphohydrolase